MLETTWTQIGLAIIALASAFVFLKGDEPERIGAGAYVIAVFATSLLNDQGSLYGVQLGPLAVDLALLAAFVALAWKSRRTWPVWAAAFQGLSVCSLLLPLVDPRPPLAAVYLTVNVTTFAVLASIVVGAAVAWRDRRRLHTGDA